jgi:hypothetical protein
VNEQARLPCCLSHVDNGAQNSGKINTVNIKHHHLYSPVSRVGIEGTELMLNDRVIVALNLVDVAEPCSTPHRRGRDTIGLEAD